jgi:tRNA-splicing ligase RtcB (3'-phosphate/5'-hydroxy nucleic acid ligase)
VITCECSGPRWQDANAPVDAWTNPRDDRGRSTYYIVSGKGNPASYLSSSHGAGRRMSRGEARRRLTVESLQEAMAGKSWNADKAATLLDEHPGSYKDIDQVMADQADLVTVQHQLRQVFTYKGT